LAVKEHGTGIRTLDVYSIMLLRTTVPWSPVVERAMRNASRILQVNAVRIMHVRKRELRAWCKAAGYRCMRDHDCWMKQYTTN
jgi:hypothetical protein